MSNPKLLLFFSLFLKEFKSTAPLHFHKTFSETFFRAFQAWPKSQCHLVPRRDQENLSLWYVVVNRLIGVEGVNLEPLKQKCKSHLAVSRFQQMHPLSLWLREGIRTTLQVLEVGLMHTELYRPIGLWFSRWRLQSRGWILLFHLTFFETSGATGERSSIPKIHTSVQCSIGLNLLGIRKTEAWLKKKSSLSAAHIHIILSSCI